MAKQPDSYDDELARIEASIAELKLRDMAAAAERSQLASKMQAALFQRDILAHANQQKAKKPPKTRRIRRRPPTVDGPPAYGEPGTPAGGPARTGTPQAGTRAGNPRAGTAFTGPPGAATDGVTVLLDDPPPGEQPPPAPPRRRRPAVAPPPPQPEASSQSVQNILLALGALLIGVAAVVFASVVSNALGRAAILAACTAVALAVAPRVARTGLTSTAETVAAVGLVLLPMTGYTMHGSSALGGTAVPPQFFLGLTFLLTAVVAFGYAGITRLAAPRYATVLAVQPVPPLLAYTVIESPAGWALALTTVALVDLLLLTTLIRTGRLVPRWPVGRPVAGDRTSLADADARRTGAEDFAAARAGGRRDVSVVEPLDDPFAPARPESAPEEPDLIIDALAGHRRRLSPLRLFRGPRPAGAPPAGTIPATPPATPPSARWLRELTFGMLVAAVAAALVYAAAALLGANVVADALRSGLILVLAALTAVAAAGLLRQATPLNIAGGVLTLAVIGAVARVAAVASPSWTLVAAAGAVAATGAVVRQLADEVRRGPQFASAVALALIGTVVALDALRAAFAPVQAARPVWQADTAAYAGRIAEAAGPSGWLLALSALLLTVAAALALPLSVRHEGAVVGVALTALSVPASLGLPWSEAPWPLVVAAIGLGGYGLLARSHRVAVAHIAAAGVVGLFGAGAALSAPWLTAAVLTAVTGAGIMIAIAARQLPTRLYAWLVGDWAAGAAALALPGAVVTAGLAMADPGTGPAPTEATTVPVLAAGFVAVAATLSYAAVTQVARREISTPLTAGTGVGALAMTVAAFRAPGATAADVWVGALLLVAAGLLFFAPTIDAGRRADRLLDGPDVAAAAATVAITGALARVAALLVPDAPLAAAGAVVLLVAVGVRALRMEWRRGPVRGVSLAGLVVAVLAGWQALAGGLRVLAAPGPFWAADLSAWPDTAPPGAWQAPVALVFLTFAAAAALPRPMSYDVAAVCATLATIGAPAGLGLPWWSPLLVGGAVALGYGVAAVAAADPRAALARAGVATAVLLHAVGAGLARPWSTAVALALVVGIGALVAVLARTTAVPRPTARVEDDGVTSEFDDTVYDRASYDPGPYDPGSYDIDGFARDEYRQVAALALDDTGMPRHRAQIGGAATAGLLLAVPGVLAAYAATQGRPAHVVLAAALAGSSVSLALLTLAGRWIPQYLPWATMGIVGGATITAVASLPTDRPTALYAAAAALLGVVAELLRGATRPPGLTVAPGRQWAEDGYLRPRWTSLRPSGLRGRWSVDPATGAVAVAALPTALAVISMAPILTAALLSPYAQVEAIWQGPVPQLADPMPDGRADGTSVLAAVLLTVAAALAAVGFGGRRSETVPVVLPGLAVTLLIAPIALDAEWPTTTTAGLTVFTIAMLGLALTPPPVPTRAPLLRASRALVFVIGLAAGGAGLMGSLATRELTLFTLGSAVGVGLVAALAGRSQHARILGWLFAAVFGALFSLTAGLVAGLAPAWSAFGVMAVAAALLSLEALLPRLGLPEHLREAATVEWSGYAVALLAGALAFDAPPQLAALLCAWGAVLGLTATRPGRPPNERRMLFWLAVGFEIAGWWLLMTLSDVAVPEAYTLPFAALALLVGLLEARQRPDLSSWAAYGPALLAAFVPSIGIVLSTEPGSTRELLLLLGAVGTLIVGSRLQQQAPVVVGAAATTVTALHLMVTNVGPWLVLVPVGMVLLFLGAGNESRRRTQERVRGALVRMR